VDFPDSLHDIVDSFCGSNSLSQITFSAPARLRSLSGFAPTALTGLLVPDRVGFVRGFRPLWPDSRFRMAFTRESICCDVRLDRRSGFISYAETALKTLRAFEDTEPLSRGEATALLPPAHETVSGSESSDPYLSDDHAGSGLGSAGPSSDDPDIPPNDPWADAPDQDSDSTRETMDDSDPAGAEFEVSGPPGDDDEAELFSNDPWTDVPVLVIPDPLSTPASEAEPEGDSAEIDPDVLERWVETRHLPVEEFEAAMPNRDAADAVLNELNDDLQTVPPFIIDVVESLQRSDTPVTMTPLPVIESILELDQATGAFLELHGFPSLTEYVRARSRTDDDLDTQPLFVADDTGSDRCTQVYRCSHAGCRAGFKIKRYQSGMMVLGDHRFEHDHEIGDGSERHYHTLPPDIRAQIIEMTAHHATPGMIRTLLDVNAPAGIFYEARRKALAEQRRDQAQHLEEARRKWRHWETHMVPAVDGEFQGFFAVNKQVIDHQMCRDTLGMDDAACTNFFEMPVFGIVSPDPNDTTQLVAYAILRDQSAEALIEFLRFVRYHLKGDEPAAFVVDRAFAERRAIEEVFARSHICFCLLHIFRNLEQNCGAHHEVVEQFWPAMRGTRKMQEDYHDLLLSTFLKCLGRADKQEMAGCLARLWNEWPHVAPYITGLVSCMETTSRNEGFNATVKNFIDHRRVTLDYLANALRLLGEMGFRRSLHMRTRFIPRGILSLADQLFVGQVALNMILCEMRLLQKQHRTALVPATAFTGECCPCHRRRTSLNFPCCHLLREKYEQRAGQAAPDSLVLDDFFDAHFDGLPLLALNDVPVRWHRLFAVASRPAIAADFVPEARHEPDLDWDEAMQFFQECVEAGQGSPVVAREIRKWQSHMRPLIKPKVGTTRNPDGSHEGVWRDPPTSNVPGRAKERPARSSPVGWFK
jgi:hypothetical protein